MNGVKIVVPRGEKVLIKRKYAEALDHSIQQDKQTSNMQMRYQREFEAETKRRGMDG